jgi:hypothetical protein
MLVVSDGIGQIGKDTVQVVELGKALWKIVEAIDAIGGKLRGLMGFGDNGVFTKLGKTDVGKKLGGNLKDSFVGAVTGRGMVDAISGLAGGVKKVFGDKLEVHSPSRVFQRFGEQTVEGYRQGVDAGAPDAARAVGGMVVPSAAKLRGNTTHNNAFNGGITINVDASGAKNAAEVARTIGDSIRVQLTKCLEDMNVGLGVS